MPDSSKEYVCKMGKFIELDIEEQVEFPKKAIHSNKYFLDISTIKSVDFARTYYEGGSNMSARIIVSANPSDRIFQVKTATAYRVLQILREEGKGK